MAWAGRVPGGQHGVQPVPPDVPVPPGRPARSSFPRRCAARAGRLLLPDGEPFMDRFDPRGELASRDVVARAIDHEIKRLGVDCVFLDISHRSRDFIESHFPTIHARCLSVGIDIARDPIPVVPAAHYTCGGVVVDRCGATDVEGLYAIGETACTGLHGANRLASNSLLECMVLAESAAERILEAMAGAPTDAPRPARLGREPRDRLRRGCRARAQLAGTQAIHVGLRRDRAHRQAPRARLAPHRTAQAGGARLLREPPRIARPHRVAQPHPRRGADGALRAFAPREPGPALHLDYPATGARALPSVLYPTVDPLDVLQPPARAARRRRAKS